MFPEEKFIEETHVQFLESSGARVVPVDYELNHGDLKAVLAQLNGFYIPGDSIELIRNTRGIGHYEYTIAVSRILEWA